MALINFSNARQVGALAVGSALLLGALDYGTSPKALRDFLRGEPRAATWSDAPTEALLRITMPHMCCSGCIDDLREALRGVRWIGAVSIVKRGDDEELYQGLRRFENVVSLEIVDVDLLDFMELDRAIRDAGLAAAQIEFADPGHFRLEAGMKHICCPMCAEALDQRAFDLAASLPAAGRLRWLDSVTVNKDKKLVTMFARYGAVVDVTRLLGAFNQLGFTPRSLRVARGDNP